MTSDFGFRNPDTAFLADFDGCRISNADFGHRKHLRAAWAYLTRYGLPTGARMMAAAIARAAAHHGHSQKYHRTITVAWIHLVAAHALAHPARSFDEFIAQHSRLLDKNLIECFYSRAVLFSDRARLEWIEPDLRAFPRLV